MKTISLLKIEENSPAKHHLFQEHDAAVYTLLERLTAGRNEFSIEIRDEESITSFGLDSDADLVLNHQVRLQKDGPDVCLEVKHSGLYCFSIDLSSGSGPMLRIQADHLETTAAVPGNPDETGLDHFLNSKLPVTLEVGSTDMPISNVLSLATGSIIELDRMVGESLDVYVGKELVAKGEVVIMPDNTFGARVVKVMPVTEELDKAFTMNMGVET